MPADATNPTIPENLISHLIHTCIVCSDLDRSLDFYTRILGASVGGRVSAGDAAAVSAAMGDPGRRRWRGAMLYWGEATRTSYVDLIAYDEGNDGEAKAPDRRPTDLGFSRLALRVPDVERAAEHLSENGVTVVSPVTEIEIEGRRHRILFFLDPDGTLLEFSERVGPSHKERDYSGQTHPGLVAN